MRDRVIAAAHARFAAQGFGSTSVADIAADLEVAPTYLYKFFDSKIAIGEAVCNSVLETIDAAIWRVARGPLRPGEKVQQLFAVLLKESVGMFFAERRLHDLVARSLEQDWSSIGRHQAEIRAVIGHILDEGRAAGAFDPALDRAEAVEALFWALHPFAHPRILEQSIHGDLEGRARTIGRFCVRALAAPTAGKVTD